MLLVEPAAGRAAGRGGALARHGPGVEAHPRRNLDRLRGARRRGGAGRGGGVLRGPVRPRRGRARPGARAGRPGSRFRPTSGELRSPPTGSATRRSSPASPGAWPRRPQASTSPRRCWPAWSRGASRVATVTLHVGPGTFLPVRTSRLEDHRMHAERYEVPEETCRAFDATRQRGGRVVAVGTTAVRTLESAFSPEGLTAGPGRTDIFIRPGHAFRAVDGMLTNFHLPRSTLLALVCAFGGTERVLPPTARRSRRGIVSSATATPWPALRLSRGGGGEVSFLQLRGRDGDPLRKKAVRRVASPLSG